ncbi:MAG TPA: dethiobiotin synthase [Candidatus Mcinerneyibacterium sp.]|nr:dethiobiotin synthase [Candidatus Mcinerneyibacterium sp.]
MAKNIFIAATDKDVGKSTVSFALINQLLEGNYNVGFMKPIGQRWRESKWGKIEEDVILIKEIFKLKDDPNYMNPVVVNRGFTTNYLNKTIKPNLSKKILNSYQYIQKNKDFVIIEGTGHAGVGSVIDHSNADVASLLDSKVVLMAKGGIGSTIDKLELNRLFFERKGIDVIGVIINKVLRNKIDKVKKSIKKYCKKNRLRLFGIIPYSPILGNPTLGTIIEELKPVIYQETNERNLVLNDYLVVASHLKEAINIIEKRSGNLLLVIPSERLEISYAIPSFSKLKSFKNTRIFTILFSGLEKPDDNVLSILKNQNINVLWKKGDTFSVISALSGISIKTRPFDNFKIDEINKIVKNNVNTKKLFKFARKANIIYGKIGRLKRICYIIINKIKKFFKKKF